MEIYIRLHQQLLLQLLNGMQTCKKYYHFLLQEVNKKHCVFNVFKTLRLFLLGPV